MCRPPLVITFGLKATSLAEENLKKTPILFTFVISPKTLKLGNGRLCGIGMHISIQEFFKTLKEIRPNASRVMAFYSSAQGKNLATEGEYLDLHHEVLYTKKNVDPDDFSDELLNLKGKIDAFHLVADPLYTKKNFKLLSDFCKKHSIVLMTGFRSLVNIGATFGFGRDSSKMGILTGKLANRLLSGKSSCGQEIITIPKQALFFLNEQYARESNIQLPQSVIQRAKQNRLMAEGIDLFNQLKFKQARYLFEALLEKDHKNTDAQYYVQLIIQKQSGKKIAKLISQAQNNFIKKEFGLAIKKYHEVLVLNANSHEAKKGYSKSRIALSEVERVAGTKLSQAGKSFQAIRKYLASLKTWPDNAKGRKALTILRNGQRKKIPKYLQDGISLYSMRDYQRAINTFQNIILVTPGHKKATEYLRLARKKKKAIDALLNCSVKGSKDCSLLWNKE